MVLHFDVAQIRRIEREDFGENLESTGRKSRINHNHYQYSSKSTSRTEMKKPIYSDHNQNKKERKPLTIGNRNPTLTKTMKTKTDNMKNRNKN